MMTVIVYANVCRAQQYIQMHAESNYICKCMPSNNNTCKCMLTVRHPSRDWTRSPTSGDTAVRVGRFPSAISAAVARFPRGCGALPPQTAPSSPCLEKHRHDTAIARKRKSTQIKLEFLTWPEERVSLQSPPKRSRYVDSCSKISGNDRWNRYVFSLWQKSAREADG